MRALSDGAVAVIDPDPAVRMELVQEVGHDGLRSVAFDNVMDFVQQLRTLAEPSFFCVVSELTLIGCTATDLLSFLDGSHHVAEVIFFAQQPRMRDVVRVMRMGALAVVEKADGTRSVMNYIDEALAASRKKLKSIDDCRDTLTQLRKLKAGECAVLRGILAGKLNKKIAEELGVSMRTVEQRRQTIFKTLDVVHPAPLACKVMRVVLAPSRSVTLQPEEPRAWIGDARVDLAHLHVTPPVSPEMVWQHR